jgi:alpha-L-fucosidase
VWFDWWIEEPAFKPYLQRFAAFYYNRAAQWQRGVVINYKNQAFPDNAAVLDIERGKLDHPRERVWQTDTSLGLKSWGYIQDEQYRTPVSLVGDLVDIVSKNGVLLLNVGPKPDGTIPEPAQHDLLEMGKWLAVNGEAIYGTRPWKIYGEGPTKVLGGGFTDAKQPPFTAQDIRFTTKGDVLYAILLGWPAQPVTIESLTPANLGGREVESVKLLGSEDTLHWHASATGLEVTMPGARPCDYAYSLRITLKRD